MVPENGSPLHSFFLFIKQKCAESVIGERSPGGAPDVQRGPEPGPTPPGAAGGVCIDRPSGALRFSVLTLSLLQTPAHPDHGRLPSPYLTGSQPLLSWWNTVKPPLKWDGRADTWPGREIGQLHHHGVRSSFLFSFATRPNDTGSLYTHR